MITKSVLRKSFLTAVILLVGVSVGAGLSVLGFDPNETVKAESDAVSTVHRMAQDLKMVQTISLMIVPSEDGRLLFGYGDKGGGWDKYELQAGVKGTPVVHHSVAGLTLEGEEISQIAAFSHETGKWHPYRLAIPTSKRAVPIVYNDIVLYWVEGHAYAFSGKKGAWDVVPCNAQPLLQAGSAVLIDDQRIAGFSVDTARWATLKMDDVRSTTAR